jgi:sterol desaturase/sphingolipid hydroxylase (fatty acid hydroxylase superfamily)
MITTVLTAALFVLAGMFLWTLGEYLLHRFAMHALKGKGIMSREHLEHHVHSSWYFSHTHLMSWAGVFLVGGLVWAPIGWFLFGPIGAWLGVGWIVGYFTYEYLHAMAHLKGPKGRYSTWHRRSHFHHHFGHPLANHGVTLPIWDKVFGTYEEPGQVRVPRRLALPWMLDERGELRPELADDYVLVGAVDSSERLAALDRARAFASIAPAD